MQHTLQEKIDKIKEKFHLDHFYLKRHHLFKEISRLGNVSYILNMEWFPELTDEESDDLNPPGTVSIDVDFHTLRVKNIVFVNELNLLDGDLPAYEDTEAAMEWVEDITGLEFGRQFKLVPTDGSELSFIAAVDNIPVFPGGEITLEFNGEGKLSVFSIFGEFPDADQVDWEPFSITGETVKEVARNSSRLLQVPLVDNAEWKNVYRVPRFLISNRDGSVLSFEEAEQGPGDLFMDEILEWDRAERSREITEKTIDQDTEVTLEEALANRQQEPRVLTDSEQETVVLEVRNYLMQLRPEESGKWKITSITPDEDYLFAELKRTEEDTRVIQRKLTIVLEADSLEAVNLIDNEFLLDAFADFTEAPAVQFPEGEAISSLTKYLEAEPVYVYDKETARYRLYGIVSSPLAVDAATGELSHMEEIS